jgi:single-strand DNA-binding protein
VNSWTITGRLGHDARLNATRDGTAVLNLSVAVDQRVKRNGEWTKETLWVDVTLFGVRAESLSRMLRKGGLVAAHGRLGLRNYEARDGTQKTALELVADDVEPLADAPGQERYSARDAGAQRAGGAHRDELAGQQTRGGSSARGQGDLGAYARKNDGVQDYDAPPVDDDIPF